MKDRRTSKRISVNHDVRVEMDGVKLVTTLVDISRDGALLAVHDEYAASISKNDLGQEVTFRIKPKGRPVREYTGEIIRLFYKDERLHLGLRFWKNYTEVR